MSWGIKITILYLAFVGLIVTMVAMSSRQKVDLVSKDYYEQELRFQEKLDRSDRSNALKQPLTWKVDKGTVLLNFPTEFQNKDLKGSVYFFRPSDATMDATISIPKGNGLSKSIPTTDLARGVYKMEISWEAGGQKFYNEGIITIH